MVQTWMYIGTNYYWRRKGNSIKQQVADPRMTLIDYQPSAQWVWFEVGLIAIIPISFAFAHMLFRNANTFIPLVHNRHAHTKIGEQNANQLLLHALFQTLSLLEHRFTVLISVEPARNRKFELENRAPKLPLYPRSTIFLQNTCQMHTEIGHNLGATADRTPLPLGRWMVKV